MLSMTNQPRSSSVAPAVDRPAPDIPVTTRYSLTRPLSHGPGGAPGTHRLVEPPVDRVGHLVGQPREGPELLEVGPAQGADAPELLSNRARRLGPSPGMPSSTLAVMRFPRSFRW